MCMCVWGRQRSTGTVCTTEQMLFIINICTTEQFELAVPLSYHSTTLLEIRFHFAAGGNVDRVILFAAGRRLQSAEGASSSWGRPPEKPTLPVSLTSPPNSNPPVPHLNARYSMLNLNH
jgi:hypothetical protein